MFNTSNFGIQVAYLLYVEGCTLFQGQPNTKAGLHVQGLVLILIWW